MIAVSAAAIAVPATAGASAPPTDPPSTDPPTSEASGNVDRTSDGVLKIGVLLPQTGPGAWIGSPGFAAANYAVAEINRAGGFNGTDVLLVSADEGESPETALAAIDELLAADVDAVVGPASSTVALQTLHILMDAEIVTCSPTASSLLLDDFPNRELFFRTIPSDSLQMSGIAKHVQQLGVPSAVILYLDDDFGRGLATGVTAELEAFGVELETSIAFDAGQESLDEEIDELSQYIGSTIIVLADQANGVRALQAISTNVNRLGGEQIPRIITNDAVRPNAQQWEQLVGPIRTRVERVGPTPNLPLEFLPPREPAGSEPLAAPIPDGPFTGNTIDCVNLIALAAIDINSDDPVAIAAAMPAIADRGLPCDSFADCRSSIDRAEPLDIDYQGVNLTNVLYSFNEVGDLAETTLQWYRYNDGTGIEGVGGFFPVGG